MMNGSDLTRIVKWCESRWGNDELHFFLLHNGIDYINLINVVRVALVLSTKGYYQSDLPQSAISLWNQMPFSDSKCSFQQSSCWSLMKIIKRCQLIAKETTICHIVTAAVNQMADISKAIYLNFLLVFQKKSYLLIQNVVFNKVLVETWWKLTNVANNRKRNDDLWHSMVAIYQAEDTS